MIQAKIVSNIKFPKIALGKDLEHIARNIIIPDIQKGILGQKAINGGSLPKNEQKTLDRKRKKKQSRKSLIADRVLLNSFIYKASGINKFKIKIKSGQKRDIAGAALQNDGKGGKFYNFFGISKNAHKRAMKYMKDRIKRLISGH